VDIIRVVVADDHPAVLASISDMLARAPDIEVVGQARDGVEALSEVRRSDPDVLLVDVEMPLMSGIEVARALAGNRSDVRVLAVSAYDDRHYIRGILQTGAAGYVAKDEAPERLVEAVRAVSNGSVWVSQRVAERMATWVRAETGRRLGFDRTELEVLRLLIAGTAGDDIAATLGLSRPEVDECIKSACAKLNAKSRWECIRAALDMGLM
jgi:DNA-binding NarL/FixJ family response regulator